MQDNEPLMRALSKLVALNNPDLTLFVGEALVGNEAVSFLLEKMNFTFKFHVKISQLTSEIQIKHML